MASSPPAVFSDNILTKTPDSDVSAIMDRRNEARRWMQINYWDEFEEVYRSSKCLTKKIMATAKDGSQVEDTTRTNVRMPETSLIIRRKTARLTANMPEIRYTSQTGNLDAEQKLTALNYQNFDRSGEIQQHRMLVQSGVMFGFGVTKLYWDTIEVLRKFFKSTMSQYDDPQEQAAAIAKFGQTMSVPQRVKKYEGPCAKNIFIGDFFIEPGIMTVAQSAWAIENFWETDLWLKKMVKKTCIYPDGSEHPIFDPKAAQDLMEMGTWNPNFGTQQPYDLRTRFRTNVLGQQVPLYPVSLIPGKRFDILEQHCRDADGTMWITWIGNEKIRLGTMPYQWDMYGKYTYTEFVPLFDPLSVYGDSTPRLGRFLQSLHDATVGSRKDLVSNILRPVILSKWGEDVPDEAVQRMLFKEIKVKDLNSFKLLHQDGMAALTAAISAANEEEGQIMRMMALMEPNINNTESGTQSNPQAGKTATTAVLAAKSADALTQFELDSLNWYLKEQNEKKLAMLQQQEMDAPYDIGQKYYSKVEGLTERYGKTASMSLDYMDIQEEFEVEPVAMSMLSVDDDIRRQAAQELAQAASAMPGVIDPHYVARFWAGTIRGIDPDKAVPPPQPPQPPEPKVSIGIQIKWPELPPEIQAQLLQKGGAQLTPQAQQELQESGMAKDFQRLSEMADAADNVLAPSSQHLDAQEPETALSKKA